MSAEHGNDKQMPGYESRDVNLKLTIVVGVLSILLLIFVLVGLDQYFTAVVERQVEKAVMSPISRDLQALRAHEDSMLNSYGLVDSSRGVYRIPIDSAIALLAAESETESDTQSPNPDVDAGNRLMEKMTK